MSFEINWDNVGDDPLINNSIKSFLNSQLQSISLPSYVNSLQVTNFCLGNIPPKIILREITDPLDEFYEHVASEELPREPETDGDDDDGREGPGESRNCESEPSPRSQSDLQFLLEIDYKGDMQIDVNAELALNYPSPSFMSLPVKLSITDLGVHVLCLVAYLSKQMFISFLCDVADPILDARESIIDSGSSAFLGKKSLERISLIRSIKIESEIGEQNNVEGSVLRSVGRLEQFLLEVFRTIVKVEAAWPSWINLDFNEDDDDEDSFEQDQDVPTQG
ncbi:LAME_0D10242g1_1 [Lachancea meyersii CBS 8951]|uniref:Mitochondrial distribution and morphology protein 12 n=1 Tax=Lachancea meyersii CBS 8951 TaxID=1266667 RepID=A0A1G4JBW8_9SACH|nr:LAME_0D10242g1_1 [Lachancea meyersii CBS 8951]